MTHWRSLFTTYRTLVSRMIGLLLLVYVVVSRPPKFGPEWVSEIGELVGFVLLVIAAFGRVWCLMFISGNKSESLTSEGPYSIVRNPLYVFSFLGAVGLGLAVENPYLALMLAVLFMICYPITVAREETRLSSLFGAAYAEYCASTPRWIPNWRLYRQPETMTVSPAKFIHGMVDSMWFLWLFLFWEALELSRDTGVLQTWF